MLEVWTPALATETTFEASRQKSESFVQLSCEGELACSCVFTHACISFGRQPWLLPSKIQKQARLKFSSPGSVDKRCRVSCASVNIVGEPFKGPWFGMAAPGALRRALLCSCALHGGTRESCEGRSAPGLLVRSEPMHQLRGGAALNTVAATS